MLPKLFLIAIIGVANIYAQQCQEKTELMLRPIEWTGGPFEWDCGATKDVYARSGKYIGKNCLATRCQVYKDECVVALPRYKSGCPVTLAKVSLKRQGCEATLVPFPCWSVQDEHNPDGLVSVVDCVIDANEILWVLDCGVVHTLETPVRYCKPKVVAYSMKTGKQLKSLDLSGLVVPASRLQYLVVEYSQDGKPFVYVSDAATKSILVFDIVANKGYRVVLPKAVLYGPCCKRDVLYIALVQKGCGNNYLIFTYLSSSHMFSIRTDYLRTGSTAGRIVDLGQKPQKMIILGTDLGSAIFFRYEGLPEVYRWDSNTPFVKENFVVVYISPKCLLTTCVCADLRRQRLRLLESNFPDYIQNTVGCGAQQVINILGGCT